MQELWTIVDRFCRATSRSLDREDVPAAPERCKRRRRVYSSTMASVVLGHQFLAAGTAGEVFAISGAPGLTAPEVGVGRRKVPTPSVPRVRMNSELRALRVSTEVHVHSKEREWKTSLSASRRFLRGSPHLTSPSRVSVKQGLQGKGWPFVGQPKKLYQHIW